MKTTIETLATLRPCATFLALNRYTAKTSGEVASFSIVFHMSYKTALEKSIVILEQYNAGTELYKVAKEEQLASFRASLAKMETTPIDEIDDGYKRFFNADGQYIKGVKQNIASGELHLYGLCVRKVVHQEGTYKEVKSSEKTIAKAALRRLCPVSHFRNFILNAENVESVRVEGIDILQVDGYVMGEEWN
jgi:hypothetical protein